MFVMVMSYNFVNELIELKTNNEQLSVLLTLIWDPTMLYHHQILVHEIYPKIISAPAICPNLT